MAKSKIIPPFAVGDEVHPWLGLNTATKDPRFLDRGEAYDQLNWITGRDKDHIELRRGSAVLGLTRRNVPSAHVTGLGVGVRIDGTQVPFFSFKRKLLYFDKALDDTFEVSTPNILPAEADGEDVNFMPYSNLAGAFEYITSRNSSIYKIPVANPASVVDEAVKDFHFGFAKINRARMWGMDRKGQVQNSEDTTGVYVSVPDSQTSPHYMAVPEAPVLTQGVGGSIADGTYYFVITAFAPDGTETTKGAQGTIVVAGGGGVASIGVSFPNVAGAIKYNLYGSIVSNVYVSPSLSVANIIPSIIGLNTLTVLNVAFAVGAPPVSTTEIIILPIATGDGVTRTFPGTIAFPLPVDTGFFFLITDGIEIFRDDKNGQLLGSLGGVGTINYATGAFSVTFVTAPANGRSITASYYTENSTVGGVCDFTGTGSDTFRQDDGGGKAMAIWPYQGVEYCFHVLRSWLITITQGITTSFDNEPYYEQIGVPYPRAMWPTGDGIIFMNNATAGDPKVSILQIPPGSTNLTVVPVEISQTLDLSIYNQDSCVVFLWGDYRIVSMREIVNGQVQPFNGVTFVQNLISGLWNKLDYYISCAAEFEGMLIAGDSISANVYTLFSGFDDDGTVITNFHKQAYTDLKLPGLKTVGYISLEGLIQTAQKLEVWISLDNGPYVQVYTILGNGPYVSNRTVAVGTETIGDNVVGGGLGENIVFANEYEIDIPIHTDKFEYISFMVRAIDVGYVSINKQQWKDIRWKRRRILMQDDLEIDN